MSKTTMKTRAPRIYTLNLRRWTCGHVADFTCDIDRGCGTPAPRAQVGGLQLDEARMAAFDEEPQCGSIAS